EPGPPDHRAVIPRRPPRRRARVPAAPGGVRGSPAPLHAAPLRRRPATGTSLCRKFRRAERGAGRLMAAPAQPAPRGFAMPRPGAGPAPEPGRGDGAGPPPLAGVDLGSEEQALRISALLDRLDAEFVGLAPVKDRVREIAALLLVDRLRQGYGLASSRPSLHMCFTGSPGTGKTTLAACVGE